MEIKQYIEFIREARKRGFEDQTIRNALIAKAWPENEINEAFKKIDKNDIDRYFRQKGVEKQKLKNEISLFLDDEMTELLEKRAKKNMLTLSEQIEDILRRSTLSQKNKKKTSYSDDNIDDKLVSAFSRRNTGPKAKKKKVKKKKQSKREKKKDKRKQKKKK